MPKTIEAQMPADRNAQIIQVLRSETTVNLAYSATANNNNALPSGSRVVMVSSIYPVWIKFGASGVAIVAGEAGAILIPGGGVSIAVTEEETHVAVIRADVTDGTACFAKLV
jgi:hypothetical protein